MILIRQKKDFITQDIFNTMKRIITLIFCGVLTISSYSQTADKLYDLLSYQKAINKYETVLAKNGKDGSAMYELATAYRLNNETVKAENWYKKAVVYSEQQDAKFYYSQMLLMNGKPTKAKKWFEEFKRTVSDVEAKSVEQFIELCSKLESGKVALKNFEIRPTAFNSTELDFSPSYYGDKLLFVSNRSESTGARNNQDLWTDAKYTDLFMVDPSNGNKVSKVSRKINTSYHEGSAVYSSNENLMYFTRNNVISGNTKDDENMNIRLQLMESTLIEGKWSKPKKLNFNNDNYSCAHPAISKDNKFMIFASDQAGGYGGMDLYIVEKKDDSWGVPVNLGSEINTIGNEVFPFIDSTNTVYFSSNFHPGYGGLDIFSFTLKDRKASSPQNVGLPLNSSRDDFGLISKTNLKEGYLSSNRSGEDDIYSFKNLGTKKLKAKVVNCVTGESISGAKVIVSGNKKDLMTLVSDENGDVLFDAVKGIDEYLAIATADGFTTSNDCLGEEEISVFSNDEILIGLKKGYKLSNELNLCGRIINKECNFLLNDAKITLINLCNGETYELSSDENGEFKFPLEKNCKYQVKVEKEYFDPVITAFKTTDDMKDCFDLDVELNSNVDLRDPRHAYAGGGKVIIKKGAIIELYNVYFDFNKFNLREDGLKEIDWINQLLKANPNMKIEIRAHTDSRAPDSYNFTLSNNRAKAVYNKLVQLGINKSRLSYKGVGETELKNQCSNNVECSDIEHQRNRRVEFKVTSFEGEITISKEWSMYK